VYSELVKSVLKTKYNVDSWEELAYAVSDKFNVSPDLLVSKRFIPGGRILAAVASPERNVSYINCTTHTIMEDSIEGIVGAIYHVMKASSRGQGIGVDISALRPRGSFVNNAALTSSGAVSFMFPIEAAMRVIGQAGRRGALLFSIDGDHPDVMDFIRSKGDGGLEGANISIKLNDDVARALFEDGGNVQLWFGDTSKLVRAGDYLQELAYNAWLTGDPGLIFWERSKKLSNSDLCDEPIVGVNACSETRLAQDDVCVLGSFNLAAYVKNALTASAEFDWQLFIDDIPEALTLLDNVITAEIKEGRSPYQSQEDVLIRLRRIGMGFMGLADAMMMLGMPYDSGEAIQFAADVSAVLYRHSYDASVELAKDRGTFPSWSKMNLEKFMERHNLLPNSTRDAIRRYGMRNVTTMAIAPTGTISLLAGVSSGLEPVYSAKYKRMVNLGGENREVDIIHPAIEEYQKRFNSLPPSFRAAYDVDPYSRIAVQSAIQSYVDQSCSSTINLPRTATVEDVKNVFRAAWGSGLTGITIFRDGCRSSQVLRNDLNRANVTLEGKTTCIKHDKNIYVTVNYWGERPFEIFINGFGATPSEEQMADGFARLSSHLLRRGMSVPDLCKELRQIPCTHIGSVPLMIANVLEGLHGKSTCPECGEEIRMEDGCETCGCGSKCD
jgi:ribonucleoside-diphosphate reductase alpha chain